MRITIDATALLTRSAGVKSYMHYWIRALEQHTVQDSIELFPINRPLPPLSHEGSSWSRWRTAAGLLLVNFANIRGNPILEFLGSRAGIFHASQHLVNPPRTRTRLTATIYDMTCWIMPDVHVPANVEATRAYGERVLRRAAGCIAISEQTRNDAMEILRLPGECVEVIYPGIPEQFFAAGAQTASKPYLLYVGTIEPRKNVDRIVDAYLAMPQTLRREYDLVIAGPMGWCSEQTRRRLLCPHPGVRYLGYVPEAALPELTAGATLFVFPSLYEGFGFPVAQAMACGVPVITSRGSSLQEIAGDAALLVDPRSLDEIVAAMESLACSSGLRLDLGERGRARAARFTWQCCAERSLAFFRRIAAG